MTISLGGIRIRPAAGGGGGGVPAPTTVTDLEDTSISALLHMNGADGGTTFIDSSAYKHTISNIGAKTHQALPASKFGTGAGFFAGGGDYIYASSSTDFQFGTGDFTIECWVNPTAGFGTGGYSDYACSLFDSEGPTASPGTGVLCVISNSGQIILFTQSGGGSAEKCRTSSGISAGVWSHIAFVRESGSFSIYVNGVQQTLAGGGTSVSLSVDYNFDSQMTVATDTYRANGAAPSSDLKYKGYIDEFRVSSVARYTGSSFTPAASAFTSDSSTLMLLHMDGSEGSTVFTDSSGYSRAITVHGNSKIRQALYPVKFGDASGYFDGTSSISTTGPEFAFGTGNFTMEGWFYFDGSYGTAGYSDFRACLLDTRSNGSSSTGVLMAMSDAGKIRLWNNGIIFETSNSAPLNSWTHIALVRSSGTCKFYIDGVDAGIASGTQSLGTNLTDTSLCVSTTIDHNNVGDGSLKLIGYIDEVRITKGSARYTGNFTPASSEFYLADPTKFPANPTVGQVVYADAGKAVAYICTDSATPIWTRFNQ